MKLRWLLLGLWFLAASWQNSIQSVSADDFAKAIEKYGTEQLIDVRTPAEYAQGHIHGARLVNIYDPDFRQKVLEGLSKSKPVLVYCRSGHRSMVAARFLDSKGYKVINLRLGFNDWKARGFPVEK